MGILLYLRLVVVLFVKKGHNVKGEPDRDLCQKADKVLDFGRKAST